ncbi:MAG: nucleoside triphosphate pyrophosphatase [Planctomycetota bacterium]|nr:nucleoside triphosphate pyrophosphatase [Planctomycetota bacterium]
MDWVIAESALGPWVLASASPRRRDLLSRVGLTFEVIPASVDEARLPGESPSDLCRRLAEMKAHRISQSRDTGTILGGDTVVALADDVFGKPQSEEEAWSMLSTLSTVEHDVLSGVALLHAPSGLGVSEVSHARVSFDHLDQDTLQEYVETGEWCGKAGGYAIQGGAQAFAHLIDGDLDTVIGLPMNSVHRLVHQLVATIDETRRGDS